MGPSETALGSFFFSERLVKDYDFLRGLRRTDLAVAAPDESPFLTLRLDLRVNDTSITSERSLFEDC